MARNTIGQFISALRKANGLTQQDVADRLNVSNKAVSRWERDECAPDLSVIPALAEMFGVTCDELLKGERITETAVSDKKEPKVDKQVKALVKRTLSSFKTLIWISIAASIVGLVCMFGISYGFYRPVIGLSVMMLFETCAFVIAGIAVSRMRDVKTDNELFEIADRTLIEKFHKTLGTMSFGAFFVILAVLLLSLPFVLVNASFNYLNGVMTLESYFAHFFGGVTLILAIIFLRCKAPYVAWVTEMKTPKAEPGEMEKRRKKMTRLQVCLTLLAAILFVLAPYFVSHPQEISPIHVGFVILGLVCLLGNIVTFCMFLIRQKAYRKSLLVPGIRNVLFILCSLVASQIHRTTFELWPKIYGGISSEYNFTRKDIWAVEYLWYAMALTGTVYVLFSMVEEIIKKRTK